MRNSFSEKKKVAFLLLAQLVGLFLISCTLSTDISSLLANAVKIDGYEIHEVSTDIVIVELKGSCPKNISAIEIQIQGKTVKVQSSKFQEMALLNVQSGALTATCNSAGNLVIQHAVSDPNQSLSLTYLVTVVSDKNISSPPIEVPVDYIRPQVPMPVLAGENRNQAYSRDTYPQINGYCVTKRVQHLEFRIEGGTWQTLNCTDDQWSLTSPLAMVGNPETTYSVEVRSVNELSLHKYSETLNIQLHVDTNPPSFAPTISGVKHGLQGVFGPWMKSTLPEIAWTADSDHMNVEITIFANDGTTVVCNPKVLANSGSYLFKTEDCSSAFVEGLEYKIRTRGQDKATNFSAYSTDYAFVIDRTSPTLTFTQVADASSVANFATFSWSSSIADGSPLGSDSTCILDSQVPMPCTSPFTLESLSLGAHTFEVTTSDVAGNQVTKTHAWTRTSDQTLPICQFSSADLTWINTSTASFSFNCSDDSAVRAVYCRKNNESWSPCDSLTSHVASGLTSAANSFEVRAIDVAGNYSNVIADGFQVDLNAPLIHFTVFPPAQTYQTSATFSFVYSDTESGVAKIECQQDGLGFVDCVSPIIIAGPLSEGAHSFQVRITDTAGNSGLSAVQNWIVDTTSPLAPIMGAGGEAGLRPTWTWSSGGGGNGTYRFRMDNLDLTAGTTETNLLSYTPSYDLVFGTHTLYVQERDDAGNWSTSGSASFDVKCTPGEYLQATNCIPCPVGSYQSLPNLNASCDAAPIGSYVLSVGSTSATTCPANSTTLATGSTQLNQCLGNEGFYSCESGVCSPADASYYSPANDNSRYACPANSYTQGSGAGADDISDCLAGIDFYNQDGDAATAPLAVGAGFYSAYRNDSRTACTNVPANATSVIYSGSGGGSNNCPISSVLTCSPGFTPAGISCSDNSPSSIIFTNLTNHQLNSLATSNEVALSGFDGPLTATCSDCADIARNGAWAGGTTLTGFMPGDTIAIRRNSAMSYSTDVIATVTLGVTTSSNWVITSRAPYSCNVAPWGNIAHNSGVTAYSEATPLPTSLCATLSEVRTCNDGVLSGSFAHSTCQNGCSATPWGNVTHGYSNSAYQTASVAYGQTCVSQARVCSNGTMSGSYTFTSCTVPACVANVGQSCATSNTGYYQHIDYADGFTCEVQKGNAGEVAPCANPSAGYVFAFKQCSGPRLDCAQTQLGTVKCNGTCN